MVAMSLAGETGGGVDWGWLMSSLGRLRRFLFFSSAPPPPESLRQIGESEVEAPMGTATAEQSQR